MDCETCGLQNPPGSDICGGCGGTLPPRARNAAVDRASRRGDTHRAERRQVTALICDLVDSVSLTVRLDPEDMRNIIDAYLAACENIIARHGGRITQYMGDGVLAYFGYPRADEDGAANAVRAGIH